MCAVLLTTVDQQFSLAEPVMMPDAELRQPAMFVGTLKPYQLRGITWLVGLYQQVCWSAVLAVGPE